MITDHLPLKVSGAPPSDRDHNSMFLIRSHHARRCINNFIANIFSKAFLPLFSDFNSPLKHVYIR